MAAHGGKAAYGAPLGVLMLEARFPRTPGDMGNASTWPFPVLHQVVFGASPGRVALEGARGLLPAFLDAASHLVQVNVHSALDRLMGSLLTMLSNLLGPAKALSTITPGQGRAGR